MMGSFFKPWRRRGGVLLLAIACLTLATWIRSLAIRDCVTFTPWKFWYCELVSCEGTVRVQRIDADPNGPEMGADFFPLTHSSIAILQYADSSPRLEQSVQWQSSVLGFAYGSGPTHLRGVSVRVWVIPYWSMIFLLCAMSAWFLFGKIGTPERSPRAAIGEAPLYSL